MNKADRRQVREIKGALFGISGSFNEASLAEAAETLTEIQEGEQSKLDSMPEGFQRGDQGARMQEAIDRLDSVLGSIEEAIDMIARLDDMRDDISGDLDELMGAESVIKTPL